MKILIAAAILPDMTRLLYYDDPDRTKFQARVVERTPRGLVLDQTCFFPTGGGQPHDTGTLNGVRVVDVVQEGDRVVHVTETPVPGEVVDGEVDGERRRDHLQQHHGQHLLSEAFVRVCGAETASFHLGAEACSIELSKPVTEAEVREAEALANEVVSGNREVRSGFFTAAEASKLPMRKGPPEGEGRIRVVEVEGFDCQACCGTHPRRTGEVGWIRVTGTEKRRILFVCGERALRQAREAARLVRSLSRKLSSGVPDLEGAVDRLLAENGLRRKAAEEAERELARYRAREMAESARPVGRAKVVLQVFAGREMSFLQGLANELIAVPGIVALLGGTGAKTSLVLASHRDLGLDLRPVLREALTVLGGKGGGAPHFVQGGGEGGDVAAALDRASMEVSKIL